MIKLKRFIANQRGNIAIPGTAILVVVFGIVGGAIDLMSVSNQKSSLQDLADNAALAAVHEMAVSAQNEFRVKAVAAAFVESSDLPIERVITVVDTEDRKATVEISAKTRSYFPLLNANMSSITASATAVLSGKGGNICMIGLSPNAMSTLRLRSRARITADTCAIYSNSTSSSSMSVASTAEVKAELICVAGGYQAGKLPLNGSNPEEDFRATTLEDCTPVDDPLALRVAPEFDTCDFNNVEVRTSADLEPGVYCGGLIVDGGTANLSSGEYIITGGPLMVTRNGTLSGDYVGFYLAGNDAKIQFDYSANIDISAPREGRMTGLLLYSSPYDPGELNGRVPDQALEAKRRTDGVKWADHTIRSDNARRLVGTIYLPNGKLLIDGRNPIADRSEYTVIIADTFELQDGPNLVLRTDYHLSDIPVPSGVGPVKEKSPRLVE
ncbi:MAG: TadE/TadG family type IV pilus assembly protein [Pseudomonadota bacterium]|nr:TadE/TadG family type IV pilus assembly protein [Pseudomonadota bacterium]